MRVVICVPILLSAAGFVLAMLTLFAGKQAGFMEDYYILMVNTSDLGHNLVPTPGSGSQTTPAPTATSSGGGGLGGIFSQVEASVTAAAGAAETALASLENGAADKLAAELGIKEFYSLHAMGLCEGDFTPNATAPNAGQNVTRCLAPLRPESYNISALINLELSVGPFHLDLADLQFSRNLQNDLDDLAKIQLAAAIIFILGAGFSGISMLSSAAAMITWPKAAPTVAVANLGIAALAWLMLLIGDVLATVVAREGAQEINNYGSGIGLSASAGSKFLGISWAAFALMILVSFFWVFELVRLRRERGSRRAKYTCTKEYNTRY